MEQNFGSVPVEDVDHVLLDARQLQEICKRLGSQIDADYAGRTPLMVGVLNGACVFMSDLIRCISIPVELDFISVSSYGRKSFSGELTFRKDVDQDLKDREVIIVEDIVDTGRTLKAVKEAFATRGAASVHICTLLDKKARRAVEDMPLKYVGWECPDEFVIGYGIDYAEHYRSLPFVGALKRSVYEK